MPRRQSTSWLPYWSSRGRTLTLALILLVCFSNTLYTVSAVNSRGKDGSLYKKKRKGKGSGSFPGRQFPETPRLSMLTPFGPIRVSLLPKNAPLMVDALVEQSKKREQTCKGCKFYRAEARAVVGPPYGLVQGSLGTEMNLPKTKEGSRSIKEGDLVILPRSNDFYIALQDHPDWSSAHTVVGTVDDFVTADLISVQPTFKQNHPQFSTEMQMLKDDIDFVLTDDMAEMIMPRFLNPHLATQNEENEDYEYEYVDEDEEEENFEPGPEREGLRKKGEGRKTIKAPDVRRKKKNNGMLSHIQSDDQWAGGVGDKGIGLDDDMEQGMRDDPPLRHRPRFKKKERNSVLAQDDIRPPDIKGRRKKRGSDWDMSAQDNNEIQMDDEWDTEESEKIF